MPDGDCISDILHVQKVDKIASDTRANVLRGISRPVGGRISKHIGYNRAIALGFENGYHASPVGRGRREAVREQKRRLITLCR